MPAPPPQIKKKIDEPKSPSKPPTTKVQQESPTTRKKGTVPVILLEPGKWPSIEKEIRKRKINFIQARRIHLGMRITSELPSVHRKLTKFFGKQRIQFHTYLLSEEKNINVIIRGLEGIAPGDVKKDLEEQGFHKIECVLHQDEEQTLQAFKSANESG